MPFWLRLLLSLNANGCTATRVLIQMIRLHPSLPNTIDLYIQIAARCVHYYFLCSLQPHCVECSINLVGNTLGAHSNVEFDASRQTFPASRQILSTHL